MTLMFYMLQIKLMEKDKQLGFSLIEVLISMAIGMVIIGALTSTFVSQRRSYDVQQQITEAVQMARAAMNMMQSEVRLAGYDPTEAGFSGIPYSSTQLQVLSDLNSDGDTSDSNENITYAHYDATDEIKRNTGGGFQPFANNIQSFTFSYLNADGNTATNSTDIRQVQINITVRTKDPDPNYESNNGYRTISLTSYITPRNLKYQY